MLQYVWTNTRRVLYNSASRIWLVLMKTKVWKQIKRQVKRVDLPPFERDVSYGLHWMGRLFTGLSWHVVCKASDVGIFSVTGSVWSGWQLLIWSSANTSQRHLSATLLILVRSLAYITGPILVHILVSSYYLSLQIFAFFWFALILDDPADHKDIRSITEDLSESGTDKI